MNGVILTFFLSIFSFGGSSNIEGAGLCSGSDVDQGIPACHADE